MLNELLKIIIAVLIIGGLILGYHKIIRPLPIGASLASTAIAVIDTRGDIPGFPTVAPGIVLTFHPVGDVARTENGEVITPVPISQQPIPLVNADAQDSQDGLLNGDVGINVHAALNANNGAIRHFIIQPGDVWDFGRSIAPVSALGYLPLVGGIAGGGWCNLAAQYVSVADQLGLESQFPPHTGGYGDRFPGIWINEDGSGGTLTIRNTQARPIEFNVTEQGSTLIVRGKLL